MYLCYTRKNIDNGEKMESMDLSELHDCEQCHGKMVLISVNKLGITSCGYCSEQVNYEEYAIKKYKILFTGEA